MNKAPPPPPNLPPRPAPIIVRGDDPPVSRRGKDGWHSPGAVAGAVALVLSAIGGPATCSAMFDRMADQKRTLDRIERNLTREQARTTCLLGQIQARQAVDGRNLILVGNFAAELNGEPPNKSFPNSLKVEKPLVPGPIKFGTEWERYPDFPPCVVPTLEGDDDR